MMIQEKISKEASAPEAVPPIAMPQKYARRRIIGTREILLVVIAFALLALFPTMAQRLSFSSADVESPRPALGSAERPDENFAGSAFYFMENNYSTPANSDIPVGQGTGYDVALPTTTDPSQIADLGGIGGLAAPFRMTPGTVAYSRALKCLTDAIYYEAANEPDSGQRGVAQVIINRMKHPTYPNSICGVIYQGSERSTGCQFSYSCDGSMRRTPNRFLWDRANRVAAQALNGYVHQPVGMATHYHATYVYPYWAPSLHFIATIGAHRFYRWKGSAGRPSAFFRSHAGAEPFPGPKPRAWTPQRNAVAELDPVELQKKYEREYAAARLKAEMDAQKAARQSASPAPRPEAPAYADITPQRQQAAPKYSIPDYSAAAKKRGGENTYAGTNLPEATNIKPEYQQSGTWKKQPGS